MDIIIQSLGFKASEGLESFVKEKIAKLEHYSDSIIRADVTLFKDAGNVATNNYCEIRLEVPGNDHFVKKHSEAFEHSIVDAVDTLQSIMRKNKDKEISGRHQ